MGKKISDECKKALVELVKEEVEAHKEGKTDHLTHISELVEIGGVSVNTIRRSLEKYSYLIPKEDWAYRKAQIKKQSAKRMHENPICKCKISGEDKIALAELVAEEIKSHKEGRLEKFSK